MKEIRKGEGGKGRSADGGGGKSSHDREDDLMKSYNPLSTSFNWATSQPFTSTLDMEAIQVSEMRENKAPLTTIAENWESTVALESDRTLPKLKAADGHSSSSTESEDDGSDSESGSNGESSSSSDSSADDSESSSDDDKDAEMPTLVPSGRDDTSHNEQGFRKKHSSGGGGLGLRSPLLSVSSPDRSHKRGRGARSSSREPRTGIRSGSKEGQTRIRSSSREPHHPHRNEAPRKRSGLAKDQPDLESQAPADRDESRSKQRSSKEEIHFRIFNRKSDASAGASHPVSTLKARTVDNRSNCDDVAVSTLASARQSGAASSSSLSEDWHPVAAASHHHSPDVEMASSFDHPPELQPGPMGLMNNRPAEQMPAGHMDAKAGSGEDDNDSDDSCIILEVSKPKHLIPGNMIVHEKDENDMSYSHKRDMIFAAYGRSQQQTSRNSHPAALGASSLKSAAKAGTSGSRRPSGGYHNRAFDPAGDKGLILTHDTETGEHVDDDEDVSSVSDVSEVGPLFSSAANAQLRPLSRDVDDNDRQELSGSMSPSSDYDWLPPTLEPAVPPPPHLDLEQVEGEEGRSGGSASVGPARPDSKNTSDGYHQLDVDPAKSDCSLSGSLGSLPELDLGDEMSLLGCEEVEGDHCPRRIRSPSPMFIEHNSDSNEYVDEAALLSPEEPLVKPTVTPPRLIGFGNEPCKSQRGRPRKNPPMLKPEVAGLDDDEDMSDGHDDGQRSDVSVGASEAGGSQPLPQKLGRKHGRPKKDKLSVFFAVASRRRDKKGRRRDKAERCKAVVESDRNDRDVMRLDRDPGKSDDVVEDDAEGGNGRQDVDEDELQSDRRKAKQRSHKEKRHKEASSHSHRKMERRRLRKLKKKSREEGKSKKRSKRDYVAEHDGRSANRESSDEDLDENLVDNEDSLSAFGLAEESCPDSHISMDNEAADRRGLRESSQRCALYPGDDFLSYSSCQPESDSKEELIKNIFNCTDKTDPSNYFNPADYVDTLIFPKQFCNLKVDKFWKRSRRKAAKLEAAKVEPVESRPQSQEGRQSANAANPPAGPTSSSAASTTVFTTKASLKELPATGSSQNFGKSFVPRNQVQQMLKVLAAASKSSGKTGRKKKDGRKSRRKTEKMQERAQDTQDETQSEDEESNGTKRRKKIWRSKHKNVIDPVFLGELEHVIQDLASCQLEQKISTDFWPDRPLDSMPSIFRRRRILSSARRRKEVNKMSGKRSRASRSSSQQEKLVTITISETEDNSSKEQRLPLKKRHHHHQQIQDGNEEGSSSSGGQSKHHDEIEIEIEIGTLSPQKDGELGALFPPKGAENRLQHSPMTASDKGASSTANKEGESSSSARTLASPKVGEIGVVTSPRGGRTSELAKGNKGLAKQIGESASQKSLSSSKSQLQDEGTNSGTGMKLLQDKLNRRPTAADRIVEKLGIQMKQEAGGQQLQPSNTQLKRGQDKTKTTAVISVDVESLKSVGNDHLLGRQDLTALEPIQLDPMDDQPSCSDQTPRPTAGIGEKSQSHPALRGEAAGFAQRRSDDPKITTKSEKSGTGSTFVDNIQECIDKYTFVEDDGVDSPFERLPRKFGSSSRKERRQSSGYPCAEESGHRSYREQPDDCLIDPSGEQQNKPDLEQDDVNHCHLVNRPTATTFTGYGVEEDGSSAQPEPQLQAQQAGESVKSFQGRAAASRQDLHSHLWTEDKYKVPSGGKPATNESLPVVRSVLNKQTADLHKTAIHPNMMNPYGVSDSSAMNNMTDVTLQMSKPLPTEPIRRVDLGYSHKSVDKSMRFHRGQECYIKKVPQAIVAPFRRHPPDAPVSMVTPIHRASIASTVVASVQQQASASIDSGLTAGVSPANSSPSASLSQPNQADLVEQSTAECSSKPSDKPSEKSVNRDQCPPESYLLPERIEGKTEVEAGAASKEPDSCLKDDASNSEQRSSALKSCETLSSAPAVDTNVAESSETATICKDDSIPSDDKSKSEGHTSSEISKKVDGDAGSSMGVSDSHIEENKTAREHVTAVISKMKKCQVEVVKLKKRDSDKSALVLDAKPRSCRRGRVSSLKSRRQPTSLVPDCTVQVQKLEVKMSTLRSRQPVSDAKSIASEPSNSKEKPSVQSPDKDCEMIREKKMKRRKRKANRTGFPTKIKKKVKKARTEDVESRPLSVNDLKPVEPKSIDIKSESCIDEPPKTERVQDQEHVSATLNQVKEEIQDKVIRTHIDNNLKRKIESQVRPRGRPSKRLKYEKPIESNPSSSSSVDPSPASSDVESIDFRLLFDEESDCDSLSTLPPLNELKSTSRTHSKSKRKKKLKPGHAKKPCLKAGLFSFDFKMASALKSDQSDPKMRSAVYRPEDHPFSLLPPPYYCGRQLRQKREDFVLPFDVWCQHSSGSLPTRDVLATWNYKRIKSNVYCDVKTSLTYETPTCHCKLPCHPSVMGCGDDCINRMTYTECDPSTCSLGDRCSNTAIQKHSSIAVVERFMTEEKGWGIRTRTEIPAGSFIMEYVGEVVSDKEFKRRMQTDYQKDSHHYCLHMGEGMVIDGHRMGGECRFVNHSCQPNCEIQKWSVNGQYRMALFSAKHLRMNEELTYDYNFSLFNPHEGQVCRCKTSGCRGVIGGKYQRSQKTHSKCSSSKTGGKRADKKGEAPTAKSVSAAGNPEKGEKVDMDKRNEVTELMRKDVGDPKLSMIIPIKPMSMAHKEFCRKHSVLMVRNLERVRRQRDNYLSNLVADQSTSKQSKPHKSQKEMSLVASKPVPESHSRVSIVEPVSLPSTSAAPKQKAGKILCPKVAQIGDEVCRFLEKAELQSCLSMLHDLPSSSDLPAYYELISQPIDYNTVKNQARNYPSVADLDQDLILLFQNGIRFFGNASPIGKAALKLRTEYITFMADNLLKYQTIVGKSEDLGFLKREPFIPCDEDDMIQCPCLQYRDEGVMIQCESCSIWQHIDCVRPNEDPASVGKYECASCSGVPPNLAIPMIPQPDYASTGETYYVSLEREDKLQVTLGMTVYVLRAFKSDDKGDEVVGSAQTERLSKGKKLVPSNGSSNNSHLLAAAADVEEEDATGGKIFTGPGGVPHKSISPIKGPSKEAAALAPGAYPTYKSVDRSSVSTADMDIFRVERLWINESGTMFAFGYHYLRSHETFHEPTRKFFHNEVFRVPLYEVLPLDTIWSECWVLDPVTFSRGRPLSARETDVYICEYRVDKTARLFNKISKWKYPVCSKHYAFHNFDLRLKISRQYTPHGVPEKKARQGGKGKDDKDAVTAKDSQAVEPEQVRPDPSQGKAGLRSIANPASSNNASKKGTTANSPGERLGKLLTRLLEQMEDDSPEDASYLLSDERESHRGQLSRRETRPTLFTTSTPHTRFRKRKVNKS